MSGDELLEVELLDPEGDFDLDTLLLSGDVLLAEHSLHSHFSFSGHDNLW